MTPEELLAKISEILTELDIPYAVTGGFAISVWGKPRYTSDIDIVVQMFEKNVKPLAEKLVAIDKDVYADEDMIRDALINYGEFNFIHPDSGIKVDFFIMASTPYNKLAIKRRILRDMYGAKAYFVSPEDLILSKLAWSRESYSGKQLADIETIIKNTEIRLDFKYLSIWAEKQGTSETLEKLLKQEEVN